ncbi:MAG TPA: hypothetical protein P5571_09115 [Candidatus Krumholzibacteria bacterium]|nr:hypothetical protein [Candidatus Krumholzibacteria bacterium]HRX51509.1 hypothetical protein [Candidatus Krumholzibacteria bacterium]
MRSCLAGGGNASIRSRYEREWSFLIEYYRENHTYFQYKYEDFVAGRFEDLSEYLEMELRGSSNVDVSHLRVVRTKSKNNWKHWFNEEDVEFFRPIYQEFIDQHGYDPAWTLENTRDIKPEHSYEYYYRLISEKRSWILRPVSRQTLEEHGHGPTTGTDAV